MTDQNRNRRDQILYAAIGGLSAAQTFISTGDISRKWTAVVGISLGILIALKAKVSNNKEEENNGGSNSSADTDIKVQ